MYKATFKLRTITPLFMYGADGEIPEIRAASIKGMIRFWWRAARAESDLRKLQEEENNIFGGSSEKEGKSSVKLICENSKEYKNNIINIYELKWNYDIKQRCLKGQHAGIGYLLYSTTLGEGKPFFKAGIDIDLNISSFNKEKLNNSIASLWLSVYLGGFGTRSRRGGGNLEVINADIKYNDIDLDFKIKGSNTREIINWLEKNTKKAIKIVNNGKSINDFLCKYSNLSILRSTISKNPFDNWIKALNDIGLNFSDFRIKNKSNRINIASFGLPSKHIKVKSEKINRRNSPLIFKLLKIDKNYYWFIIRLTGKFLPDKVVLENRNNTQKPDYSLLDEFWNSLRITNTEIILNQPKKLIDIKNRLIEDLKPSKIILFGSRARGDFSENSDIDIAVKTKEPLSKSNISGNLDLIKLDISTDKSLFEKINKEGVIIYER